MHIPNMTSNSERMATKNPIAHITTIIHSGMSLTVGVMVEDGSIGFVVADDTPEHGGIILMIMFLCTKVA